MLDVHRPERVLFAKHIEKRGIKFFRAVCANDCEGIIAKRKDGIYAARNRAWIKTKNPKYSQGEGRGELFDGRKSPHSERRLARIWRGVSVYHVTPYGYGLHPLRSISKPCSDDADP